MKVFGPEDFTDREVKVLFCLQEQRSATALALAEGTGLPVDVVRVSTRRLGSLGLLRVTRPARPGPGLNPFVYVLTAGGARVGVEP